MNSRQLHSVLPLIAACVLLAASALTSHPVRAQDNILRDVNPLRIADVSSPRETLRSFLDLSAEMIRTWRAEGSTDRVYVLLTGVQETLDFSATSNGTAPSEQVRRVLLLREVLDRIDLPPLATIPGDDLSESIDFWEIPGTRLRIERLQEGPRSGDFVFGANTVEDLHLTYARVRMLPYQPGAVPILDDWLRFDDQPIAGTLTGVEDRMSRIDTSSPRSVLTGFLRHVSLAYRIATDAEARLAESPPTITDEEAVEADRVAKLHLLRASSAFDLSRIAPSRRDDVRVEATLILKEIFDRVALPRIQEVPDASDVRRVAGQTDPFVWRFPGLPINIARVLDGDQAGSFAFDPQTLEGLVEIYLRLRDLPYQDRLELRGEWEYGGGDVLTPGFYDYYASTPGDLVPSASALGRFVKMLPDSLQVVHDYQTRWQWLGLALSVAAAVVAILGLRIAFRRLTRNLREPVASWTRILAPLAAIVAVAWVHDFVDQDLNITGVPLEWFVVASRIAMLALVALLVWRVFMAIAASLSGAISQRGIDAGLIRIVCSVLAIVAGVGVVVGGLRDIGVDAVPLIAGLGVGGLAVALAIRPTLENLIGGLILHSDRPLRIGDFCDIGGMMGTIEGIGVRSTQIRALDRTLITIPNARLADMDIINWAHCDRMLIEAVLGLRYETTPDQMRHLLASIRRMLHAHPKIDRQTIRIRYSGPAASSRDVDVRIYVLTRDWNEFYAVREDVFLRIDDLVEQSGIGYAFPSQTLYITRDQLPDAERGKAAEKDVAAWRRAREMPFPRLKPKEEDRLEGTLDYPPQGSNRFLHGDQSVESMPELLSTEEAPPPATDEDDDSKRP